MDAEFRAGENHQTASDRAFEAFVAKCERLLGRKLPDHNDPQGYSMDSADAAFADGMSPEAFLDDVLRPTD